MPPPLPTRRRDLLVAAGSRAKLDLELRTGRSVAVFRGVHVDAAQAAGFLIRCRAALAAQDPRAVLTYSTAAAMHGLRWLPADWSDPAAAIHVAVPQNEARRHRDGLRLHRRLIEAGDISVVSGLACTSPTRTVVELARSASVPQLLAVQIIDGALRDGRTSHEELATCLSRFPGERGIARARAAVRLARSGVDSPQETRLRLSLQRGGLPIPDVAMELCGDDGLVMARADIGYWRFLIWGEYDGFDAHTDRRTFRGDRTGDRWLQRRGWHVMRFADVDLNSEARLCSEWRQAIADAPARIAALPPDRSPELAAARRLLGLA